MLCQFADRFPAFVALLLERERTLKRRFREETVTDMLMAGLVALEPFGIYVDFPDEPKTGADMDWVFAAWDHSKGPSYFRILLQAKRATLTSQKKGGYWHYAQLDHDNGSQAQTLVAETKSWVLPMYLFYHPASALAPAAAPMRSIDGVNAVFADLVAPAVKGRCKRPVKAVKNWRQHFLELSDILCWEPGYIDGAPFPPIPHPVEVAGKLRDRKQQLVADEKSDVAVDIRPSEEIPADIKRRLSGQTTPEDRRRLERPRAIFRAPGYWPD